MPESPSRNASPSEPAAARRSSRRNAPVRLVAWVVAAVLATGLALTGLAVRDAHVALQDRIARTHPAALAWGGERVRDHLTGSRDELAALARGLRSRTPVLGIDASRLAPVLADALAQAPAFAGLVLLDPRGRVQAIAGAGPDLDAFVALLQPRSALDSGLLDALTSTNLREDLAEIAGPSLRTLDLAEAGPGVLVSAPVRDEHARTLGSLHGVVARSALAARLPSELVPGAALAVGDAGGRPIATSARVSPAPSADPGPVDAVWAASSRAPVPAAAGSGMDGWSVVVRETALDALPPVLLAGVRTAAVAAVVLVVLALAASRSARRISGALDPLRGALRRVARGELDVELSENAGSEAQVAAHRAFNAALTRVREHRERLETDLRALRDQNQGFQRQQDTLSKLSQTDGLTELHNHRYFQEQLRREVKRLARTGAGLALLIIDIDDFKQLNDRFGHAAGDEFLRQLARILRESVRETDVLARYGGEEFVIVATNTDRDGAVVLAEKLRTVVAETSFIVDDSMRPRRVTVSIGVAQYESSQAELFAAADAALYRAKASGKNCVVASEVAGDEA